MVCKGRLSQDWDTGSILLSTMSLKWKPLLCRMTMLAGERSVVRLLAEQSLETSLPLVLQNNTKDSNSHRLNCSVIVQLH